MSIRWPRIIPGRMALIKIACLLLLVPSMAQSELISGVDTLQEWQAFDFVTDSIITPTREEIDSLKLIWPNNNHSKNTIKYDLQFTCFANTIETVCYKRFYLATYSTDSCYAWEDSMAYYFGDFAPGDAHTHYFRTRGGNFGMIKNAYFYIINALVIEWILQLDGTTNLCEITNKKIDLQNFNKIRSIYK